MYISNFPNKSQSKQFNMKDFITFSMLSFNSQSKYVPLRLWKMDKFLSLGHGSATILIELFGPIVINGIRDASKNFIEELVLG